MYFEVHSTCAVFLMSQVELSAIMGSTAYEGCIGGSADLNNITVKWGGYRTVLKSLIEPVIGSQLLGWGGSAWLRWRG